MKDSFGLENIMLLHSHLLNLVYFASPQDQPPSIFDETEQVNVPFRV